MKAVQFSQFGGPDVLEVVELPDPHPDAGQVRIAVRAVGINPIDWKVRSGAMGGDLPQTTGREVAGIVDEVGEGVTDAKPGDKVFGFAAGGGGAAQLALPRTTPRFRRRWTSRPPPRFRSPSRPRCARSTCSASGRAPRC